MPQVVNAPDWRLWGTPLGYLTNELSKLFPSINDDRGNEIPFVTRHKVESQSYKATDYKPSTKELCPLVRPL